MYKAFVAFEAPEALSPVVSALDEIVARHHGGPVRRAHPLHLTVMAPREVTAEERAGIDASVIQFNEQYGAVPARVHALACFEHARQKKHLVALVKGHKLEMVIDHFHKELTSRFSWERRQYEGRSPHITLLNSRHVPTGHLFERVRQDALHLDLPREISIPRLVVHIRQGNPAAPSPPKREVSEQGWHP